MSQTSNNFFPVTNRQVSSFLRVLLACCSLVVLPACKQSLAPTQSSELAVQGLYNATISDTGQFALVGSINHGGSLWAINSGERLYNWNHRQGDFSQITEVAISPGDSFALTAGPLDMVLWDRVSGSSLGYWNAPSEILDVDLLPGGNYAALGLVDHTATLFDVRNGGAQRIYNHAGRVNSVDTHPAKNLLLSGSDDFSARLWNLNTGEQLFNWKMDEEVQLVKLSPDGNIAFAMAKYASATLWNTETGEKIGEIPLGRSAIRRGKILTSVAFSADSELLLTGTANRVIQLWRIRDMHEIERWETPRRHRASPVGSAVLALAFASEDRFYAITSDGMLHELER